MPPNPKKTPGNPTAQEVDPVRPVAGCAWVRALKRRHGVPPNTRMRASRSPCRSARNAGSRTRTSECAFGAATRRSARTDERGSLTSRLCTMAASGPPSARNASTRFATTPPSGQLTTLAPPGRCDPAAADEREFLAVQDQDPDVRQAARIAHAARLPVDIDVEQRRVRLAVVVHDHEVLAERILEVADATPGPLLDRRRRNPVMVGETQQLIHSSELARRGGRQRFAPAPPCPPVALRGPPLHWPSWQRQAGRAQAPRTCRTAVEERGGNRPVAQSWAPIELRIGCLHRSAPSAPPPALPLRTCQGRS